MVNISNNPDLGTDERVRSALEKFILEQKELIEESKARIEGYLGLNFEDYYFFDVVLEEKIFVSVDDVRKYRAMPNELKSQRIRGEVDDDGLDYIWAKDFTENEHLVVKELQARGMDHIFGTPRLGAHWAKQDLYSFSDEWYVSDIFEKLHFVSVELQEPDWSREISKIIRTISEIGRASSESLWRRQHWDKSLAGASFKKAQSKRTKASGAKSSNMRRERIESLFAHIERIVMLNPDIRRASPNTVGQLALDDAVLANPDLWRQGRGMLADYLTELASAPEYKDKYHGFFAP